MPVCHDGALRRGLNPLEGGQAFNQRPLYLGRGAAQGFPALCKTGQRQHTRRRMEQKKQSSRRDARRQHKHDNLGL